MTKKITVTQKGDRYVTESGEVLVSVAELQRLRAEHAEELRAIANDHRLDLEDDLRSYDGILKCIRPGVRDTLEQMRSFVRLMVLSRKSCAVHEHAFQMSVLDG